MLPKCIAHRQFDAFDYFYCMRNDTQCSVRTYISTYARISAYARISNRIPLKQTTASGGIGEGKSLILNCKIRDLDDIP